MQVPMSKVQVISTHRQLEATLAALQRLGVVQLEDAMVTAQGLGRLPRDIQVENQRELLSYLLVRLDSVLAALAPRPKSAAATGVPEAGRSFEAVVAEIRTGLDTVAAEVQTLTQRREQLIAEQQSLPRYAVTIRRLMPLAAEIPQLDRCETVALLIDRHFEHVLDTLRVELVTLTEQQIEIISRHVDEQTIGAILVFPKQYSASINELLGHEHINQIRLPAELVDVSLDRTLSALQDRLEAIASEINEIQAALRRVAVIWYSRLVVWRAIVQDRVSALNARAFLAATDHTFVIMGWIAQQDVPLLQRTLGDQIGNEVIVSELPVLAAEREQVPVILQNPAVVRPFETLIRLMAMPRYATVDPSALMALFMPLMFGMILGDIAYGVAVFAIAFWLQRRYRGTVRDLGRVLMMGAVWSIVFGFLYGEFLGTLGEALGLHPIFNRAEAFVPLFATAIAVGVIQIVLGLLLGLWRAICDRHLGHLSEKAGTLVSIIALFALVAVVAGLLPDSFYTPTLVIMLVGVVLLSIPMGLIGVLLGPLEFLGTLGNMLSYLRIAAVGLASVYLAEVANEMAGLSGNLVLGVIVASLFHVLNVALGIVSPTIQALRLHYVEFFGKFFEGGGKPFHPFKQADYTGRDA